MLTQRLLLIAVVTLVGCSYRAGIGGAAYTPGATQAEILTGLSPQQHVLFRDDDLMIVEQHPPSGPGAAPANTATLRFEDGRLDTWSVGP